MEKIGAYEAKTHLPKSPCQGVKKQSFRSSAHHIFVQYGMVWYGTVYWNRQNNTKIHEIEITNINRFWDFIIYLPNLVYWVGFDTGVTFTAHV